MRITLIVLILLLLGAELQAQSDSTFRKSWSIKASIPKALNINRFPTAHIYIEKAISELWSVQGNVGYVVNHTRQREKFHNKRGLKFGLDLRRYVTGNKPTSGFFELSLGLNRLFYQRQYIYEIDKCEGCNEYYYQYSPYDVRLTELKSMIFVGGKVELFKPISVEGAVGYGYVYRIFKSDEDITNYHYVHSRHFWDDKTNEGILAISIDLRLVCTF